MSAQSQQFIPVQDIKEDMLILKDGGVAMVMQTSAVNFDLLSEKEQLAIIGAFAALLNSLSFPIQIVIRSKRLDISSYLAMLNEAEKKQNNLLLKTMMQHYRTFVESTIRENEVLDKQFYVVVYASYLELGLLKKSEPDLKKALTLLSPRRDQILRQLGRIGLKSTQLSSEKLAKLFYDIYNLSPIKPPQEAMTANHQILTQAPKPATNVSGGGQIQTPAPSMQQQVPNQPVAIPAQFAQAQQQVAIPTLPQSNVPPAQVTQPQRLAAQPTAPVAPTPSNTLQNRPMGQSPFVVEELSDEYGSV